MPTATTVPAGPLDLGFLDDFAHRWLAAWNAHDGGAAVARGGCALLVGRGCPATARGRSVVTATPINSPRGVQVKLEAGYNQPPKMPAPAVRSSGDSPRRLMKAPAMKVAMAARAINPPAAPPTTKIESTASTPARMNHLRGAVKWRMVVRPYASA